jgi:hypothetical protein
MKLVLFSSILILIISCKAKDEKYYQNTDIIEISNYSIPDSTIVFDTIQIKAHAQEPNGCWSNLNFVLSRDSDFYYKLKAYGTYASTGICPTVMVYKDTTISFIPVKTGKYLFYVMKSQTKISIDTLLVK